MVKWIERQTAVKSRFLGCFMGKPSIESALSSSGRLDRCLTRYFGGNTMDYRQVLSLLFPLLIDQAFLVSMNLFNTSIISNSGLEAVSAVNMVDSINIFVMNIFVALATGGTILVAQYKGRGQNEMLPAAMASSVSTIVGSSSLVAIFMIALSRPLLSLLFGAADPAVMDNARIYLMGSALSYIGFAVMEAVCGALRGLGETRLSLKLTLLMNFTYLGLNFILVTILDFGIWGMVIALVIARFLAALLSILHLVRADAEYRVSFVRLFHIDISMTKRILAIGMPFASEQMFFNGGKILTQTYIVGMGTLAMATNAITNSVTALFMIPANTFALAIVTIVGRCIGHQDIQQARRSVKSFLWLTSLSFVFSGLVILPFLQYIVSIFGPTENILNQIYLITYVNTAAQGLLWAGSFLVPAALRAAGDIKFTSLTGMITMWTVRVILSYVLGVACGFGVFGIWVAMELEWAVRCVVFLVRFKTKRWYAHRIID